MWLSQTGNMWFLVTSLIKTSSLALGSVLGRHYLFQMSSAVKCMKVTVLLGALRGDLMMNEQGGRLCIKAVKVF